MTAGTLEQAPQPTAEAGTVHAAKLAALVTGILLVLGAALGPVWAAWSPPGPLAAVQSAGLQADESEAWAASDARFALIVAVVGLLAGLAGWWLRAARGPALALALTVGGIGGAALTDWVGYLVRGSGPTFRCGSDTGKCIEHLPLRVHMPALLLLEAMLAALVYGLLVAFTAHDDLGHPDPVRQRLSRPVAAEPNVGWGPPGLADPGQPWDLPPPQ
jgi:hypothetical protein